MRSVATKHHVAASLSAKDKPGTLQGGADFAAGQIGGKLCPLQPSRSRFLNGLDLNDLLACFGGDRIAGIAAVLDVKLDGFADVAQRFGAGVALADASRQNWNTDDIPAILFLLQDHRVAHGLFLADYNAGVNRETYHKYRVFHSALGRPIRMNG